MTPPPNGTHRPRPRALAAWRATTPVAGLLALLVACRSGGWRGADATPEPLGHAPPERGYDVEHYGLELTLLPATRGLEGTCAIRMTIEREGLAAIELDLDGLEVRAVHDGEGRGLAFEHAGERLVVTPAEPLAAGTLYELTIAYGGTPGTGMWFAGRRADGSGPTLVFTQGQGEENRGWFPCYDHLGDRATSEVRVHLPPGWVSVAPGERVDRTEGDGATRMDHWRMATPHPTYLMSLVAGELVQRDDEWDGIPLQFFVEVHEQERLRGSFDETGAMLAFLSEATGLRYPYPKYSQACVDNFPWGGMENVSATTLTPLMLDDERGLRDGDSWDLVVHEAAHQWFGDLFTCADWSHLWLNEGFATYMEVLYAERTRGIDAARVVLRDYHEAYLAEDMREGRRATVSRRWIDPEDIMDTRIYEGGAARLHLLRYLVGEEAFREGVRRYARENAGREVVTEDLQRAMEAVSGKDLTRFFEQWIYGAGHPEFLVSWTWALGELTLVVEQRQSRADGTAHVFELPVDVEVVDTAGSRVHRLELGSRRDVFQIDAARRPTFVRFDRHGWIPKRLAFEREPAAWIAIAREDTDVNGRRDAVRALGMLAERSWSEGDRDLHEALVTQLVEGLRRDASPAVRAEAARALGHAGGLEARERLMVAGLHDEQAAVREASLRALVAFGVSPRLREYAERCFDEGYSWDTMAAAAALRCEAAPESALDWLLPKLALPSPHDVLRAGLFRVLGELPGERVTDLLRRWASDAGTHPSARAVAVARLGERPGETRRSSQFLAGLLDARSFRLRSAALEALVALDDEVAHAALASYQPRARTPGERRLLERYLEARRP